MVPGVVSELVSNRSAATALFALLVFIHEVLKWLHHPLLKYVMLWHPAVVRHDCLHCSRPKPLPGDSCMYFSPAPVSHETLEASDIQTRFAVVVGAAVVVIGAAAVVVRYAVVVGATVVVVGAAVVVAGAAVVVVGAAVVIVTLIPDTKK